MRQEDFLTEESHLDSHHYTRCGNSAADHEQGSYQDDRRCEQLRVQIVSIAFLDQDTLNGRACQDGKTYNGLENM